MNSFIKRTSIIILITAIIFMAIVALLSIWDILAPQLLWKAVSTIVVLGVTTLIVVVSARLLEEKK